MSKPNTGRKPVIFSDFDGTITLKDNIVAILKHFDPPGWEELVTRTVSGELSIREGVSRMFELFPSSMEDEIRRYVVEHAGIRPGFRELLHYCKERDIEFHVTSGGIDFFLLPLLQPYAIERNHIYCNESDFSGDRIRIVWPHTCDDECGKDCGMCKPRVLRRYAPDKYVRILIGDSLTDFEAARIADVIFARSHLADRCRELGYPFFAYETFYDVIDGLNNLSGGAGTSRESNHP